jgi:hypothetical protein
MSAKNIIMGVIGVLLLIFVLRYFFSKSNKISGMNDATKVTKISASSIDSSTSNNYAYSAWIYVDDWSYRYGEPKTIMGRLDSTLEPSPSMVLGAIENNLTVSVACYSSEKKSSKSVIHNCNVANIPLQKWVNIIISLYGRTLDVYIDGKLVRTCILPGVAKVPTKSPIYITPMGGFSGYTANIQYFSDSLNPQQAYNIYKKGYGGSGLSLSSFPYSVKVSFMKDNTEEGSVTI